MHHDSMQSFARLLAAATGSPESALSRALAAPVRSSMERLRSSAPRASYSFVTRSAIAARHALITGPSAMITNKLLRKGQMIRMIMQRPGSVASASAAVTVCLRAATRAICHHALVLRVVSLGMAKLGRSDMLRGLPLHVRRCRWRREIR